MAENNEGVLRTMASLGLDFSTAIKSTQEMISEVVNLNEQLKLLKASAGQSAKDINAAFAQAGGKSFVDQYGNSIKNISTTMDGVEASLNEFSVVNKKTFEDAEGQIKKLILTYKDLESGISRAETYKSGDLTGVVIDDKSSEIEYKNRQRIVAEYERQAAAIKQSTLEQMKAQTSTIQQGVNTKRLSQEYVGQAQVIRQQVIALQQKLALSGQLSQSEVQQTHQLQEQLKLIQAQMRDEAASQTGGFFGSELGRRVGWFVSGAAFYGTMNAARDVAQTIREVEFGMVEIGRVMEDATFQTERYRDSLMQLGVEYGQNFGNVQDIALRWAQAGYNVADSLELTRTALLALNTAELDATNATEAMVGIMAQWQLQAGDLELVMDKINKTADNYTVTSQDLVDGLLRSSGAARVMNMSMDETIALLTVMREASGRTGREVGSALNSILSYLQRPKAISVMESLGIDVFADEMQTQFRSAMDIFKDIERNWGTASDTIKDGFISAAEDAGLMNEELAEAIGMTEKWTDVQKRDIAQGAAGVYRRNYFIGMIERLSNAQGVLNGLTDAGGYSMAENERTMDSLEKKVLSLQASVEQLSVTLGDAGLLDAMKSLVDLAKDGVEAFNDLPQPIKELIVLWAASITTLKLLEVGIKALGLNFTATRVAAVAFNSSMAASAATITAAPPAVIALNASLAALRAGLSSVLLTLKGFAKANAPLLIISALISASIALSDAEKRRAEESAKAQDIARQNIAELDQEVKALTALSNEYNILSGRENQTVEDRRRLLEIQRELSKTFPELTTGIDREGNAIAENTEKVKALTEAKKEQLEIELQALNTLAQKSLPGLRDELSDIDKRIEELSVILNSGKTVEFREFQGMLEEVDVAKEYSEEIIELSARRRELTAEIEKAESVERLYSEAAKVSVEAYRQGINLNIDYQKAMAAMVETTKEFGKDVSNLNQAIYDLNNGQSLSAETILELIESYNLSADAITKTTDGYKVEISTLDELRKIRVAAAQEKLEQQKQEIANEKERLSAIIASYGMEIQQISNLATARKALSGDFWSFRSLPGLENVPLTEQQRALSDYEAAINKLAELEKSSNLLQQISSDASFGVKTSSSRSGTSESNKALTNAIKLLEHSKATSVETQARIESEIVELNRINLLYAKTAEERMDMEKKIYAAEKRLRDKRLQDSVNWINKKKALDEYAVEDEIAAWNRVLTNQKDNIEAVEQATINLHKLQKQLIEEQLVTFEDAYKKRIQMIEDEAERRKDAVRDEIEELQRQLKSLDRGDSERTYEQTIAGIQEEIAYWRVRTSEEARKKVIELEQKLEEEKYKRELELQKQTINDRIDELEDEVSEIERLAEEEKKAWEATYKSVEASFKNHVANVVSLAGAMSKEAYNQWKQNYIDPLQEAFLSGTPSQVSGMASGITSGTNSQIYSLAKSILDLRESGQWNHTQESRYFEELMRIAPSVADMIRNSSAASARAHVESLPKFHTGGKTLSYGVARYKPGELVFPPGLSEKLEALIQVLGNTEIADKNTNQREIVIDKLLNIEKNTIEDTADVQDILREVKRAVDML